MGDLSQLLYYGVYVLLVLLSLATVARAMWAPADLHRRACCGGCGHGVTDVLQGRCQECGGLYVKVGISTPSMAVRLRGSLALALLAWTTFCALGSNFTYGWLQQRAWASYQTVAMAAPSGPTQDSMQTTYTPWSIPWNGRDAESADEMNFRIELDLASVTDGTTVESGTATMTLRKNGEPNWVKLTIDLADGSFVIADTAGTELETGAAVDAETIARWFKAAGIPTAGDAIARTMKDALRIARYAKDDPQALRNINSTFGTDDAGALQQGGMSTSSGGAPVMVAGNPLFGGPPGITGADLGVAGTTFGVLYLAGVAVICWRHRRLVRAG